MSEPKVAATIADLWESIIEPLSGTMKFIVTLVVGYEAMGIINSTLIYIDEKGRVGANNIE